MKFVWPVRFYEPFWHADLAGASDIAAEQARRWRDRIAVLGGLPDDEALRCRPDDDLVPLPRCMKVRIPDVHSADLKRSPWGVVLRGRGDTAGPFLYVVAFGLRHPEAVDSTKLSVYATAHRRLFPPQ